MAKTLLYRFLRVGRVPKRFREALEAEDLVLLDEGIPSSITYRNYRAPGKWYSWRRDCFTGSIVMTETRSTAFSSRQPVINVPLADARLGDLRCGVDDDRLVVSFEAGAFEHDRSGSIECRFTTPNAGLFLDRLPAERQGSEYTREAQR